MKVQDIRNARAFAFLRPANGPDVRKKLDIEDSSPVGSALFISVIAALFLVFILWAYFTTVEEVTRGEGRVIPSGRTQVVQASEPGVILEINVRAGQQVREGDELVRLDSTPTSANLGELEAQSRSLRAQIARLRAEYEHGMDATFECPADIRESTPDICTNEANLLQVRHQNQQVKIQGLLERVEQRERELAESRGTVDSLSESLELGQSELEIMEPLAERNIVPRTEVLRLRRDVNDQRGQLNAARESIGRTQAALREANFQVEEQNLLYRQEALTEMTSKLAQLSVVQETIRGAEDRVRRTTIRSPVDGIVNAVHVNTVGSFVTAGGNILDVVPLEDKLLIEARVRPSDIAFLRPGQEATVKITAYDFSIFGGLEAEVIHISADSVLDEETREPYYVVLVETDSAFLRHAGQDYPIMPGMVAQVDILTGEKSILDYLLKPINKARQEALRER
jgi:membrane fusion protein, adhesin transport system